MVRACIAQHKIKTIRVRSANMLLLPGVLFFLSISSFFFLHFSTLFYESCDVFHCIRVYIHNLCDCCLHPCVCVSFHLFSRIRRLERKKMCEGAHQRILRTASYVLRMKTTNSCITFKNLHCF